MKPLLRILAALMLVGACTVTLNYRTLPTHNTAATHFDTVIVLGYPANPDGTPAPEQRERTLEGVREYRAGVAPRIILTGGPAHNQFTEAHAMALLAGAQGVPPADIFEEPQALNTIQNVFYSAEIMRAHGWRSAEVVSSPSHLPRAGLILATFNRLHPDAAIAWRTHAAPWPPEYTHAHDLAVYAAEAGYCLKLRLFGFPHSRFLPAAASLLERFTLPQHYSVESTRTGLPSWKLQQKLRQFNCGNALPVVLFRNPWSSRFVSPD